MRRPPAATLFCLLAAAAAGCGGSGASDTPSRGADSTLVRQWPKRWCRVRTDMTKRDVYRLMGRPTATFRVTNLPARWHIVRQAAWSTVDRPGGDYTLRAFFFDTGEVAQLQAVRAPVRCAKTRNGTRSGPA